jgi:hypothetical protein
MPEGEKRSPSALAGQRGRPLAGNLMAVRSVLRGRVAPEDMLLIPPSDGASARPASDRTSLLFRHPLEEE